MRDSSGRIDRKGLALVVVLDLIATASYLTMLIKMPGIRERLAGDGASLPTLTETVFAAYPWFGLALLISAVPSVALFSNRLRDATESRRLVALVIVGFAVSIALFAMTLIALYVPLFTLADRITD